MLRKIRTILAGVFFVLITLLFLDFTGTMHRWCLQYLFASVAGQLTGDAAYVIRYFQTFSADPIKPCLWGVAFVLITHLVVSKGVNDGIERASKLLMPLLLILLVVLVVASCIGDHI